METMGIAGGLVVAPAIDLGLPKITIELPELQLSGVFAAIQQMAQMLVAQKEVLETVVGQATKALEPVMQMLVTIADAMRNSFHGKSCSGLRCDAEVGPRLASLRRRDNVRAALAQLVQMLSRQPRRALRRARALILISLPGGPGFLPSLHIHVAGLRVLF
jgi:hypothetical protein